MAIRIPRIVETESFTKRVTGTAKNARIYSKVFVSPVSGAVNICGLYTSDVGGSYGPAAPASTRPRHGDILRVYTNLDNQPSPDYFEYIFVEKTLNNSIPEVEISKQNNQSGFHQTLINLQQTILDNNGDDLNVYFIKVNTIPDSENLRIENKSSGVNNDTFLEYLPSEKQEVTVSTNIADGDTITIEGVVYEFDTNSNINGDVAVDISSVSTEPEIRDALIQAINNNTNTSVYAYVQSTNSLIVSNTITTITFSTAIAGAIAVTTFDPEIPFSFKRDGGNDSADLTLVAVPSAPSYSFGDTVTLSNGSSLSAKYIGIETFGGQDYLILQGVVDNRTSGLPNNGDNKIGFRVGDTITNGAESVQIIPNDSNWPAVIYVRRISNNGALEFRQQQISLEAADSSGVITPLTISMGDLSRQNDITDLVNIVNSSGGNLIQAGFVDDGSGQAGRLYIENKNAGANRTLEIKDVITLGETIGIIEEQRERELFTVGEIADGETDNHPASDRPADSKIIRLCHPFEPYFFRNDNRPLIDLSQNDREIYREFVALKDGYDIDTGEEIDSLNPLRRFTAKDGVYFDTDIHVKGSIFIQGGVFDVNVENLNISDRIARLNDGETSAGVSGDGKSGIVVDRGTLEDTSILWDESKKAWVIKGDITGENNSLGVVGAVVESERVTIGDGIKTHGTFNAKPNGDIYDALIAAFKALPEGGEIYIKRGDYFLSNPLRIPTEILGPSNVFPEFIIRGEGAATKINTGNSYIEFGDSGSHDFWQITAIRFETVGENEKSLLKTSQGNFSTIVDNWKIGDVIQNSSGPQNGEGIITGINKEIQEISYTEITPFTSSINDLYNVRLGQPGGFDSGFTVDTVSSQEAAIIQVNSVNNFKHKYMIITGCWFTETSPNGQDIVDPANNIVQENFLGNVSTTTITIMP